MKYSCIVLEILRTTKACSEGWELRFILRLSVYVPNVIEKKKHYWKLEISDKNNFIDERIVACMVVYMLGENLFFWWRIKII